MAAVAFIGASLAPFFLNDPRTGDAADAFAALAELDAEAAAAEWPFVEEAEARASLAAHGAAVWLHGADDEELVWEYRRLFVGPAPICRRRPGARCTPTASASCSARPRSPCAPGCARIGVARTTDERTPEDHIGLMLALHRLSGRGTSPRT